MSKIRPTFFPVVLSIAGVCLLTATAGAVCVTPAADVNGSGSTDVVDVTCLSQVGLWSFLGQQGPAPSCAAITPEQADVDCDGEINVPDIQLTILSALGLEYPAFIDSDADGCADACDLSNTIAAGAGFEILYKLPLELEANYDVASDVPYSVDRSAELAGASALRVGYILELNDGTSPIDSYIFVSFAAPSTDVLELGVPTDAVFQQPVVDLSVQSNVPGIPALDEVDGGSMEFWSNCYSTGPGTYDALDDVSGGTDCYGSLQVHFGPNVLLAYNRWSSEAGPIDLGIGNATVGPHPDHTFLENGGDYVKRNLYVVVDVVDAPDEYELVYDLDLPKGAQSPTGWDAYFDVPYAVDNSAVLASTPFSRIGYLMVLNNLDGPQYVWATMDAFTSTIIETGMPVDWMFQTPVGNLSIESNVAGVPNASNLMGGNIEFWSSCYQVGANDVYDDDDTPTQEDCYGSFQLHANGGTVFAFNSWSNETAPDVGIGPNTGNTNPDWTFMYNAANYTESSIQVFILPD